MGWPVCGLLAAGGFDPFRAAEEVVEEHPAPLKRIRVLADYDVLQIYGPVQAGKGEEENGFGDYQMHIDIIIAANLDLAEMRVVHEA